MLGEPRRFLFRGGYRGSSPKLEGESDVLSDGSTNLLVTGSGKNQIFKGVTVKAGVTGSQVLMNADDTYGGLGDHSETGLGSVFRVLSALFFIGVGKLYYAGAYLTDSATTTLSLKLLASGSWSATYQAGSTEPSAPTISAIDAPSGYTGKNTGTVSVKLSRFRSSTGSVSNASPSSNLATASSQSIAVTFPSADFNGQDYWKVYGTKNAEGGIGNTYFLQDIAESTIAETVAATATTDADTTIGVPNDTLTAENIGWQYTSSGDTTTYVTAVGADDSHSAGLQEITLNAASVLSTSQSATFTRAINGVTRTYVFEWRDGDLEPEFAPIRNFSPPAGIFGGTLQDVAFIDGCYGDTANVSTQSDLLKTGGYVSTNVGNAIAISEPAAPESYPPDNYIFTGDKPTCLLQGGDGVFWRWGRNSLGVLRYIGGSPAISYEQAWEGIGVADQNSAVLGQGGRVYAFTGTKGLVRIGVGGLPDTLFATPVMDDISSWTSAKMGYDGVNNVVCVMNGLVIHAFYEPLEIWCAPITLTGLSGKSIKAAVTIQNNMYLAIGDASSIALYDFNVGSGSTAKARTAWIPAADVSEVVARIASAVRIDNANNSILVKVYANGDDSTARRTFTITPTAGQVAQDFFHLTELKPNVTHAKSYRIEMQMTSEGGNAGFEGIVCRGEQSGITW